MRGMALLLWALCACTPSAATQVVVRLDVEEGSAVGARAAAVRVRVFDAEGLPVLDETRRVGTEPASVSFPASVSLLPRDPDAARRFRVEAALLEDDGAGGLVDLAVQRAEGAFVPGALREIRLRFTDACAGVACSFGRTCVAGACVRACFEASAAGGTEPSEPASCPCGCACDGDRCAGGACEAANALVEVAAGRAHACAIDASGTVLCWGSNTNGQLGVGDTETRASPTRVSLPLPARAIAAGWRHTCAILEDGSLHCWGDGAAGQLGPMSAMALTPVPIANADGTPFTEVSLVATGDMHTCISTTDGTVYCWGDDEFGQVGGGTASPGPLPPTRVLATSSFDGAKSHLVAGFGHTCALQTIGRLWCWGRNFDGNLGVGDREHRAQPTLVLIGTEFDPQPTWTAVSASNGWHTCAIGDGLLYCFGDHNDGRLGVVSAEKVVTPARVLGDIDFRAESVAAGVRHTCARRDDGQLFCFGTSASGELGVGEIAPSEHGPVELADEGWERVALGESFSCAIRRGGALHCWGQNEAGQLGLGHRELRSVPVRVCP